MKNYPETKCPECGKTFDKPHLLGAHRKKSHGIAGTSPAAVYAQKRKAEAAAAEREKTQDAPADPSTQPTKRTYTKRSQLAPIPATQNGTKALSKAHQNGHHSSSHEAFETAVAYAFGRYTELCASIAREFDLPPVSFARQLAVFISKSHP